MWLQRRLHTILITCIQWCHSMASICIVGNVGAGFWQGRRVYGIKTLLALWTHFWQTIMLKKVCLPGRHHCLSPRDWSSCSSQPDSDTHTQKNRSVSSALCSTLHSGGPQSGTLTSNTCYHGRVRRHVLRWTTWQAVILGHGPSVFYPLHTHEGWRRAQSDGLLQLELQKKKTVKLTTCLCVSYLCWDQITW